MTWNDAYEPRVVEIACDESGSDGENLTGGNTDVFAHAGVRLPMDSAAAYVQEIRDRIRSPAEEYKANHLLREKHRAVLEWLLAPAGPIHGDAKVHLTEKTFFVVDRVADLLLGGGSEGLALFREGPRVLGEERWRDFLQAANRLLRIRNDGEPGEPVDGFFRTVEALRRAHPGTDLAGILERLAAARPRADAYRARVLSGPVLVPVLNPLLPAIVGTAAYWSAGGRTVQLTHDRQNMLTPERIAWIQETARRSGVGLGEVHLVHSRLDARVQVADYLAGIARKIASDVLNRRADPELTALLRPYVDPASAWGDERSWALLAGDGPGNTAGGTAPEVAGKTTHAVPSADINSAV
ncbi:DUF3800 domain-containing protein [Streptomyces sp. NPDC088794]|uniref:DUF3800 domain-containing protein n=1 Tax=Streptomyces sp. NPDC088794 TaxID=3365902 RepID=UPI00382B3C88